MPPKPIAPGLQGLLGEAAVLKQHMLQEKRREYEAAPEFLQNTMVRLPARLQRARRASHSAHNATRRAVEGCSSLRWDSLSAPLTAGVREEGGHAGAARARLGRG